MKLRPACPLCVTLVCPSCGRVEQQINREWIETNNPRMKCRRHGCGAAYEEKTVRHTAKEKHQNHVDAYARKLLTKAPKLIVRDPIQMALITGLLITIENDFFNWYSARNRLASGFYDEWDPNTSGPDKITAENEMTAMMLRIESAVRRWTDANPAAPDGFHVVGDNSADGDSVHLFCLRCPEPDRPDWMTGAVSNGLHLGRFLTMKWDDPPAIATLRDLFTVAREHDVEVHGV